MLPVGIVIFLQNLRTASLRCIVILPVWFADMSICIDSCFFHEFWAIRRLAGLSHNGVHHTAHHFSCLRSTDFLLQMLKLRRHHLPSGWSLTHFLEIWATFFSYPFSVFGPVLVQNRAPWIRHWAWRADWRATRWITSWLRLFIKWGRHYAGFLAGSTCDFLKCLI